MIRTVILAVVLTSALAQVTPPVWPEWFHQSFVETYPPTSTALPPSSTMIPGEA